jgi:hypothetical protein
MRAGTDFALEVRRRNAHLAEKDVGKLFVVVLEGVNKDGFDFRMALHLAHERRDPGEIWARTHDIQDFGGRAHEVRMAFGNSLFGAAKSPFG